MSLTKYTIALGLLFLMACGNAPERGEPILDQNYQPTPATGAATTTNTNPPGTQEPAQNSAGVWHYTCPNGCSGGGGSATACVTCGTTLAHNQVYHANNNPTPPANNGLQTTVTPAATPGGISIGDGSTIKPMTTPGGTPGVTTQKLQPQKTPEPPQNAAGVWHYTCADGCAGGAGSAVACAGCGKTLAHNQAYHK